MKNNNTQGAVALALMLAYAHPAGASEVTEADFLGELPVVLTVSRLSQPVNDAPAAVTVIDSDMIRASGFRDVPELLRLVPGFAVAYTRDHTWAVAYHGVADAFSRRFQVLVDGRSIYNPAYGTVYWAEQPLAIDDIERIEVVRGPNAASYGANAFFAVINIITRTAAQTPGAFASMQAGSHGMRGLTARYGGGGEDLNWRLTFSAQDRDRFKADSYDNIDYVNLPDVLYERSGTVFVSGRADWTLSATDELSAQFGWTEGRWDSGRYQEPLEPRRQDVNAQFVQLRYRRAFGSQDEWSVQLYHTRNRIDAAASGELCVNAGGTVHTCYPGLPPTFFPTGVIVDSGYDLWHSRTNLEFAVSNHLSDAVRVAWGLEARHDAVGSQRYFQRDDDLSGTLARAWANLEWRLSPEWLVQGGAMLERHHYVGTDVSPRVAFNYSPWEGHTFRIGVSQAYRTPTFFEQDGNYAFYSTTGVLLAQLVTPSSPLAAERILSRELGYVARPWHTVQVDARLFRDSVYRFIENQGTTYLNHGNLGLEGGELQLGWQPTSRLHLDLVFARVFITADASLDNDLPDSAPVNSGSLLARYTLGDGWQASAGVYRTGYMKWLNDGDSNPGYTRVDARLAKRGRWRGYAWEAALVGQSLGGDYVEFRPQNVYVPRAYASLELTW